jgi:hypothetical protein
MGHPVLVRGLRGLRSRRAFFLPPKASCIFSTSAAEHIGLNQEQKIEKNYCKSCKISKIHFIFVKKYI